MNLKQYYRAALILVMLINASCTSLSNKATSISVKDSEKHLVSTHIYHHNYFTNNLNINKRVHVYIGSDGTPWINGRWLAADPTPSNPLALELMYLDKNPAIYLARPCYFANPRPDYCKPELWTSARYSEKTINSMALALEQLINANTEIVLIGYSGGAAIASILADKLENTVALISVAGNLDTASWTTHHNLLPLTNSINPANYNYIKKPVKTIHLAGKKDIVIPLYIIKNYIKKRTGKLWIYNDNNHQCCWKDQWPNIMKEIKKSLLISH